VLLVLGVTGPDPTLCMCCDVFITLTLQGRESSCTDRVTSQYYKLSGRNITGKFVHILAYEGVRGSRGVNPPILELIVICRWYVQPHAQATLSPVKEFSGRVGFRVV
jgi:hypothetical protein